MAKRSAARDKAVEVCRQFPDVPSRTLARQLRRDEPKLFPSVERARDHVRLIRGANGKKRRHQADAPQPLRKAGEVVLPKGKTQALAPVHIPPGKWLVLSDIHSPYHNERAIEKAVRKGEDEGCDGVYLNGDSADFYSVSRWQTDPRERDLPNELKTTKKVLEWIGSPFKRKVFKVGNHDQRWDHYIFQRAEELVGVEGFSLREVLNLTGLGYTLVESEQLAYFGKLPVIHGHEDRFGSSVNPARGLFLKVLQSALCGHLHRTSHHSENYSIKQQSESTWSTGCLCDLSPRYAVLNKWNLGWAQIEHDGSDFSVENFKMDHEAKKIWRA